ncbi:MAG: hypothetical protein ACLRO3_21895 [Parabacteroides distasonis]
MAKNVTTVKSGELISPNDPEPVLPRRVIYNSGMMVSYRFTMVYRQSFSWQTIFLTAAGLGLQWNDQIHTAWICVELVTIHRNIMTTYAR